MLNDVKVKGFQLDLRILQEFGQYDADVAEGTVMVEYCRQPLEWINLLSLRRCKIDVEKNMAIEPGENYIEHNITVYDALYIAQAIQYNLPLLTLNQRQR